MHILATIAWRNIWRNPRRSWVLITAIGVGVFCFLGAVAFMDGFSLQMVDSAIDLQGGHVQIAKAGYQANPTIQATVDDAGTVTRVLGTMPGLRTAPLVAAPGMANSAEQAAGVRIHGIDPAREAGVTSIAASMVEGHYLGAADAARPGEVPEVLLGAALADRLNLRLGEKVVLMANDVHNEVSAGAYRIAGLYRTNSADFDKASVYLPLAEAQRLLGYAPAQVSAFSVRLDAGVDLDAAAAALRRAFDGQGLEVVTWRDRAPLLVMMREMYDWASLFFVVILFTAIAFTIVNSFLMVIFERIREIGIMSANGVRPREIRRMLYLEAFFMVVLGTVLGGLLAGGLLAYWSAVGLDLSAFSEGLRSFGAGTVVYPYLAWSRLVIGFATIFGMVFLAVLYPAYKASRFEAVDALNYA